MIETFNGPIVFVFDPPKHQKINYLGNPLLKRANVPYNFTTEEVEEYIKCKDDIIYFIKNYMKVVTVDEGLVPFDLWD